MNDPQSNPDQSLTQGAAKPPSSIPESELDFMREFIELQKEQVSIRREEISLDKQQVENTHQYALRNLEAQVADRKSAREFGTSGRRDRLIFSGILIFLLISFVGVAMYLDKDQIALEIIKGVGLLAAGAFGGYSYGSRKLKNAKSEE